MQVYFLDKLLKISTNILNNSNHLSEKSKEFLEGDISRVRVVFKVFDLVGNVVNALG